MAIQSTSCLNSSTTFLTVDITYEELYKLYEKQGGKCNLSGRKLTTYTDTKLRNQDGRKYHIEENYDNICFDRIDSLENYTSGNVQIVASVVNDMKMDMPQHIFLNFVESIATTHPLS